MCIYTYQVLDLPLYSFPLFFFFPYVHLCCYRYLFEDGYYEASSYGGRLDPGDAQGLIARLGGCL